MSINKAHKFKERIVTSLILAPLVLVAIFLLPQFEFALLTAIILAFAGLEWAKLIGLSIRGQVSYVLILLLTFFIAQKVFAVVILILGAAWWLLALYLVMHFPVSAKWWKNHTIVKCFMGLLVLAPCWVGMNIIRTTNEFYLLFVFFLVWGADTGAFFIGRSFGKHKLAPNVSPGKTFEGLLGGIALTLVVAIIGGILMRINWQQWIVILLLAILIALVSVIGDLFESMMKRQANVKDSGNWLPGHGGLLDRIDSLTAAIPVFALGVLMLQL